MTHASPIGAATHDTEKGGDAIRFPSTAFVIHNLIFVPQATFTDSEEFL